MQTGSIEGINCKMVKVLEHANYVEVMIKRIR